MTNSAIENAVTKEEIANFLRKEHGWSLSICQTIVDEFFLQAREMISKDGKLLLTNFGSFKKVAKAARPGRSFKDNTAITIAAREVVSFSAAAKLREALNPIDGNQSSVKPVVQEMQPGAFHSAMTQFMSSNIQHENSNIEAVDQTVESSADQDNAISNDRDKILVTIDALLSKIYSDKQHISNLLK